MALGTRVYEYPLCAHQELVITVKASVLLGPYSPQEMSGPDRQDQESEFISVREGPQGHAGRE